VSENPYFHRGAVKLPDHFYGRDRETRRAMQLLRNGQSVSIVGPRKIGKTSLLLHLVDPHVQAEHGLASENCLFVYVNGEVLSQLDKSDVYRVMLEETSGSLATRGLGLTLGQALTNQGLIGRQDSSSNLQFRHFSRAIRSLTQRGLKVVYLLDEFEGLSTNQQLGEDFFSSLRSMTLHDVAYVTASQDPLLDLTLRQDVLSSPFFNIFALLRLDMFSRQEAQAFVELSSGKAGLPFPQPVVGAILDFVGRHPYSLQVACYHMFEMLASGAKFQEEDFLRWRDSDVARDCADSPEQDILANLADHYAFNIDRLDAKEKRALARLAHMGKSDLGFDVAQKLVQRCLAVREGSEYKCQSVALRRYVLQGLAPSWEAAVAEGERRLATLLFVDLVNFTTMAGDRRPEEIMSLVKQVTKLFSDPVERHGGSVIQFRGDGILALFGVPVEREDDAARAVRAGLDMQRNLETLGSEIAAQYGLSLSARIGLNTGVVVVGEMGNPQHSVHTAMGDAVNLAERMQRVADPGCIVVSESTYQQVRGLFRVRSLGATKVKGKVNPIKAYRVLGERNRASAKNTS
jgi:class 3 adenylate cyclase